MYLRLSQLLVLIIFWSGVSIAQDKEIHWEAQFKAGLVQNFKSPLLIKQDGFEDIKLNAKYYSEPLIFPIYGAIQISRWADNKLWELETLHHKLYLENKPDNVQQFSISHGFNLVSIKITETSERINRHMLWIQRTLHLP